jgi:hypothetical protein
VSRRPAAAGQPVYRDPSTASGAVPHGPLGLRPGLRDGDARRR